MAKYRVYSYRGNRKKNVGFSTHDSLATAKERAAMFRKDGDRVVIQKVKTSTRRK